MSTLKIGTFAQIPVKIHWTFSLLLLFVVGMGFYQGMNAVQIAFYGLFVLAVFFCVILHEYGHALAARKYGIRTLDIIISPIGGLARLEKLPDRPLQELIVAIAGPLVNVAIALLIGIPLLIYYQDINLLIPDQEFDTLTQLPGFLTLLVMINGVLFLFNLIPAFPMDGGRILRAALSFKMGRFRATKVASSVGRILAVVFVGVALMYENYTLILIGIFVFIMAKNENEQVKIEHILSQYKATQLLNPFYTKIHIGEPLQNIIRRYVVTGEHNFLVFNSLGYVAGVIPELFIRDAINNVSDPEATASTIMSTKYT